MCSCQTFVARCSRLASCSCASAFNCFMHDSSDACLSQGAHAELGRPRTYSASRVGASCLSALEAC
eukprot:14335076-Alexandrium_andersonii.AAC.1